MQKFKTRLRYYLIGFGLGLVAMFFIFGNRACSWLPENRVKNMIAEKQILVGDSLWALMQCQEVNSDDIYRFLEDDGDVNFSDSKTSGDPKEYLIEGEKEGKHLSVTFALWKEENFTEIIAFEYVNHNCETELSNDNKKIVPIPNSHVRQIIESKEMRVLDEAECQRKFYGISEDELYTFHTTANVLMSKTDPYAEPNGYYTMKGDVRGTIYLITYINGENRTRISNISGPQESPCLNELDTAPSIETIDSVETSTDSTVTH